MRKQADALKVCPIPDACLLVMAQRPYRLLGLPEPRSLIFLIKNSPDQAEGYLDYLQPQTYPHVSISFVVSIWCGILKRIDGPTICHSFGKLEMPPHESNTNSAWIRLNLSVHQCSRIWIMRTDGSCI
jgi:hypothetical protein